MARDAKFVKLKSPAPPSPLPRLPERWPGCQQSPRQNQSPSQPGKTLRGGGVSRWSATLLRVKVVFGSRYRWQFAAFYSHHLHATNTSLHDSQPFDTLEKAGTRCHHSKMADGRQQPKTRARANTGNFLKFDNYYLYPRPASQ